jgi:periplasmic protein TonB
MKRKNERIPGFDEIIFENRNKEYGAYDLRKKYLPATFWSVIGGAALFAGTVLLLSALIEKNVVAVDQKQIYIVTEMGKKLPDDIKAPEEPPKPKINIEQNRYVAPEVVDTIDKNQPTLLSNDEIDTANINRPVDDVIVPVKDPVQIVPEEPEIGFFLPEMPVFPGGQEALMKFISENVKYPSQAVDVGLEGRVVVRFVVSADGSVKRISVLKGVDPLLDQEALRVIGLLPKWKPGKNNGTPAPVWFSVPVYFKLTKN